MKQEIEKLKAEISRHNGLYYDKSSPEISDFEYDNLRIEYENLLKKYQSEDLFGEVFVGFESNEKFKKIEHKIQMLSLDNAFSDDDVLEFDKKVKKYLNLGDENELKYTAELKIDGLSFAAVYENGNLKHVCTRGDGKVGEDVTENVVTIEGFLTKITCEKVPKYLEIRGEIFLTHKNFEEIIKKQIEKGDKPFVNPRNAASGSLRVLDSNITKERKLSYLAYTIAKIDEEFDLKTHSDSLDLLKEMGFFVSSQILKNQNIKSCLEFYRNIEKNRSDIEFDIDGIVYKVDDLRLQERLSNTNKAPRWAIAYKFSGIYAITKIESIVYQVGRLGNITPVANLVPINVGGVLVSRATLHNHDEILRLGVSSGDLVKITRAGDVIPRVCEVIEKKSNKIEEILINCPSCKSILVKDKEMVALRCENSENCKDQILGRLMHFASKNAFDIEWLGKKQIERFYELGFIVSFADIFRLGNRKHELLVLERMGEKSVENLLLAIEKSRKLSLQRLIYSLSIRHVGQNVSQILARFFKNIDTLKLVLEANSIDEITQKLFNIEGVGEKIALEFCKHFRNEQNKRIFSELLSELVEVFDVKDLQQDSKFSGKKIVFTGTLLNMTRQEAKSVASRLGFEVVSSVSRNTDFVVAGEDSGSKLKLANELGVKVLGESEWNDICNDLFDL